MGDDKTFQDIMAKDAERGAHGFPSEQCPLCGMSAPPLKAQSKEAVFQNTYGAHYVCSRDAKTPAFMEFEKEWDSAKSVVDRKKEQSERALAGQAKIDAAKETPPVPEKDKESETEGDQA